MIFFTNEEEINKNCHLIPKLRQLYNLCFPDINEREDIHRILRRVKGLKNEFDPNTILLLDSLENEVIAGMVVDWYFESQCIHLTYIFVHPESRNNGIAKRFLTIELKVLIDQLYSKFGIRIKAVFLESNIPSQTHIDSFDPTLRLKIFKQIGIKWIDIPYVQPALDNNKAKVNNLYLLTIPINNDDFNEINIDNVIDFLSSLYKSLQIRNPELDFDYKLMVNSLHQQKKINNCINLKQINV